MIHLGRSLGRNSVVLPLFPLCSVRPRDTNAWVPGICLVLRRTVHARAPLRHALLISSSAHVKFRSCHTFSFRIPPLYMLNLLTYLHVMHLLPPAHALALLPSFLVRAVS